MHADLERQAILMARLAELATKLMAEKNRQRKVFLRSIIDCNIYLRLRL